jgi:cell division protein FtsL
MAPRKKKQSGAAARKKRASDRRRARSSRTPSSTTKRTRAGSRTPAKPRAKQRARTTTKPPASKKKRPAGQRERTKRTGPPRALVLSLVAVGLLVVTIWSFYPVARIQYRESREKARLERELASLQERNEKLGAEVDRLKTPEGVEEVARENLGMVRDGEHVYVVTNLQEEASATLSAEECAAIDAGPPTAAQRVLDAVFGIGE